MATLANDATNKPSRGGVLDGITVLDLCRDLAGPYCSMMLAENGAKVIEVEHPDGGDETRSWPPHISGVGGYFATINRSKRSIAINLKHQEGVSLVHELAAGADVVMQSFTPGVADRLGVGYEAICQVNPNVVYYSVSGYGQTGPWRHKRGYDPILQAASGFMSVTGERGRGPVKSMIPVADLSTAVYGYAAILGALLYRERGGVGQHIDMSMLDVMVSQLSAVGTRYLQVGLVPERNGTENPQRVPSAAFECSDGRYLQMVPNQRQWPIFCEVMGRPKWANDERFSTPTARVENQDTLYPMVRERFKTKPAAKWQAILDEATITCSPIYNIDEVFALQQVQDRGMVTTYKLGDEDVLGISLPFNHYSETPSRLRMPPPRLAEHTVEVLKELGRTDSEIDALILNGAVRALNEGDDA